MRNNHVYFNLWTTNSKKAKQVTIQSVHGMKKKIPNDADKKECRFIWV